MQKSERHLMPKMDLGTRFWQVKGEFDHLKSQGKTMENLDCHAIAKTMRMNYFTLYGWAEAYWCKPEKYLALLVEYERFKPQVAQIDHLPTVVLHTEHEAAQAIRKLVRDLDQAESWIAELEGDNKRLGAENKKLDAENKRLLAREMEPIALKIDADNANNVRASKEAM